MGAGADMVGGRERYHFSITRARREGDPEVEAGTICLGIGSSGSALLVVVVERGKRDGRRTRVISSPCSSMLISFKRFSLRIWRSFAGAVDCSWRRW